MKRVKWTNKKILAEALKYTNRKDFVNHSYNAYMAAQRRDLLNEVCLHMAQSVHYWTDEELAIEAMKFTARGVFKTKSNKAYQSASRSKDFMDKICAHMVDGWFCSFDDICKEALRYETRNEFKHGSPKFYYRAIREGTLNTVCAHMGVGLRADNNVIYIWRAIGSANDGLYKIGVTSKRRGFRRINEVSCASGFGVEIMIMGETQTNKANVLEKELHTMGINPCLKGFDGSSEFRVFNNECLAKALKFIQNEVISYE